MNLTEALSRTGLEAWLPKPFSLRRCAARFRSGGSETSTKYLCVWLPLLKDKMVARRKKDNAFPFS